MIARKNRFHGHNALNYTYRQGKTARTAHCSLRYVANGRRQTYRAAIVVSKKLSKSAVVRNRIRRRLYEQVRGLVPVSARYDLVLTAFSEQLATMPEKDINKTISGLLQTAGLDERGTVDNSADKTPRP
jgi:ribonuclease P protein component